MKTDPRLQVYKKVGAEGFEWLLAVDDNDYELLRFDGKPRAGAWKPVRMKRLTQDDEGPQRKLLPSDFPSCSGADMLMISGRAKAKLGTYLERFGELLPLECDDGEFWTLNVTTVIDDAFDEASSSFGRATDDKNKILLIRKHVFRASALADAEVFKLPARQSNIIYVTHRFVSKIRESGLVGLEFKELWAQDLS